MTRAKKTVNISKEEADISQQNIPHQKDNQNKSESLTTKLSGSQKAAAVIVSLGVDKASQLYKYMDNEDIERLTLEIAQMGFLNTEQTEKVLNEYNQMCLTNKVVSEGGLEYARTVLNRAFGEQMAESLIQKVTKSINRGFHFLNEVDVKLLYSTLQQERTQTIALVLSYVNPDKAAELIEKLEPEKQVKVIECIAKMDGISPDTVKIVETELGKRFSSINISSNIKPGGVDYAASIMNNIGPASDQAIFNSLESSSPELADAIRKRMFVFEDILTMDDRSVQRFVRDCDMRDLVLSLKTANQEVSEKLFKNMSTRMAESIKEDLEITNNVRLRDVEAAQQRIVSIIRDLEEKNEIILLKQGRNDIIA